MLLPSRHTAAPTFAEAQRDGLLPSYDAATGEMGWGTLAEAPDDAELVFLGLMDGKACFAAVPREGADGPAYAQPQVWQAMQVPLPASK